MRTGKKYLYFRCGNSECTHKQKSVRAQVFLDQFYKRLEALHFDKKELAELRKYLSGYINVRHGELLEEKLCVNAAIKAKKRNQGELAQGFYRPRQRCARRSQEAREETNGRMLRSDNSFAGGARQD